MNQTSSHWDCTFYSSIPHSVKQLPTTNCCPFGIFDPSTGKTLRTLNKLNVLDLDGSMLWGSISRYRQMGQNFITTPVGQTCIAVTFMDRFKPNLTQNLIHATGKHLNGVSCGYRTVWTTTGVLPETCMEATFRNRFEANMTGSFRFLRVRKCVCQLFNKTRTTAEVLTDWIRFWGDIRGLDWLDYMLRHRRSWPIKLNF
jgi:hypothetical protein